MPENGHIPCLHFFKPKQNALINWNGLFALRAKVGRAVIARREQYGFSAIRAEYINALFFFNH